MPTKRRTVTLRLHKVTETTVKRATTFFTSSENPYAYTQINEHSRELAPAWRSQRPKPCGCSSSSHGCWSRCCVAAAGTSPWCARAGFSRCHTGSSNERWWSCRTSIDCHLDLIGGEKVKHECEKSLKVHKLLTCNWWEVNPAREVKTKPRLHIEILS